MTCDLPDGKEFKILIQQDKMFEVDCLGNNIRNMSYVPTIIHESERSLDYLGIVNCPIEDFTSIENKLLSDNKNINRLMFKNMKSLIPSVFENYTTEGMHILYSSILEFASDLLYKLKYLRSLTMNYNNIPSLPSTFFQGTRQLVVIDLGLNKLNVLSNGLFANLRDLSTLNLFANNISTIDSKLFEDLTSLKTLELMTNQISEIPEDIFQNLTHLTKLSLRKNLFTTFPKELFKYNEMLQSIQLTDNPFLTIIPEGFFANLTKLELITLNLCNLSSLPINAFRGSVNLMSLNLADNKLKHLERGLFNDNKMLEELHLENNELEVLDELIFENLNRLEYLYLGYNHLKIQDNTFYGLGRLKLLNMEYNSITLLTIKSLQSLVEIEKLNLSHNNLTLTNQVWENYTGEKHSVLPPMEKLEELNLEYNEITSLFSDWIFLLPSLKKINLSNNKINSIHYTEIQFTQDHPIVLDLEDNLISTINLSGLEMLIKFNAGVQWHMRTIKLKGNTIHCDCHLYDFIRYIDKSMDPSVRKIIHFDYEQLQCTSPEKYKGFYLKSFNSKNFTCALDNGPVLPPNCEMQPYEYRKFDMRLIIDCSDNNLTTIPSINFNRSNIPFQIADIEVVLRGNEITVMPQKGMGYEDVVELDLSHNLINEITWVPPRIEILRLDHNNLTYLNNQELFLINHTSIKNITYHNNPWECNCKLVNFTKYIQENFRKIPNLHNITCPDGRELTSMTQIDLCPYSTYIITTICVMLAFCFLFLLMLTLFYHRYDHEIKVWLYAHNMCLYLITEDEVDQDKLYDAFVSFSHEDDDFVVNELLPKLEEGPTPFRLCVHFRDFEPGEFITTNIARAIDASRRTVVVVSQGFLRSEWGRMEFRTAHTEAMKEGRARVVVILYGDIGPVEDLDPELRAYLSTNTYIKWGSPWFWKSLRYAMPHSSKYANMPEGITFQPTSKDAKQVDDKMDLIHDPPTPPVATTPPAEAIHRIHDPLLPPSALNVSLINGSLVNNVPDKKALPKNEFIYEIDIKV